MRSFVVFRRSRYEGRYRDVVAERRTSMDSADVGAVTDGELVLKMWVLDPVITRMARMNAISRFVSRPCCISSESRS